MSQRGKKNIERERERWWETCWTSESCFREREADGDSRRHWAKSDAWCAQAGRKVWVTNSKEWKDTDVSRENSNIYMLNIFKYLPEEFTVQSSLTEHTAEVLIKGSCPCPDSFSSINESLHSFLPYLKKKKQINKQEKQQTLLAFLSLFSYLSV